MRTKWIFKILQSFTEEELNKLKLFLRSPYHNNSNSLILLFDYLVSCHPEYSIEKISTSVISRNINPPKIYTGSTVRNLFSDLFKVLLKFLELENFKRTDNLNEYLLNELGRKNLYEVSINILNEEHKNFSDIDYRYFLLNHCIEAYKYNLICQNPANSENITLKKELSALESSSEYLTLYFITSLAPFFTSLKVYDLNYNTNTNDALPVKILNELSPGKLLKFLPEDSKFRFIIKLYDSLINLYSDIEDQNLYLKYKHDFIKYSKFLSNDEKNMHAYYLISYCIHKRDEDGGSSYDEELFSLYIMVLENEYYRDSKTDYLPHELFRSILLEALRAKKYDWAWQFSEIYSAKVRPADRGNMKNLASAYICFETGSLCESLNYLNRINLDFFIFKLDVKNLTLRIFYELGYTEEAFSLIKTYKEYLRKNILINKEKKARYLSFVKFTEKLLRLKEEPVKSELGYVKYRILNHKAAAFKPWLTEKIHELESGYKIPA